MILHGVQIERRHTGTARRAYQGLMMFLIPAKELIGQPLLGVGALHIWDPLLLTPRTRDTDSVSSRGGCVPIQTFIQLNVNEQN